MYSIKNCSFFFLKLLTFLLEKKTKSYEKEKQCLQYKLQAYQIFDKIVGGELNKIKQILYKSNIIIFNLHFLDI